MDRILRSVALLALVLLGACARGEASLVPAETSLALAQQGCSGAAYQGSVIRYYQLREPYRGRLQKGTNAYSQCGNGYVTVRGFSDQHSYRQQRIAYVQPHTYTTSSQDAVVVDAGAQSYLGRGVWIEFGTRGAGISLTSNFGFNSSQPSSPEQWERYEAGRKRGDGIRERLALRCC